MRAGESRRSLAYHPQLVCGISSARRAVYHQAAGEYTLARDEMQGRPAALDDMHRTLRRPRKTGCAQANQGAALHIIRSLSAVYHQPDGLYIIKPQENTRWRVMRYKGGLPPLMICTARCAVMICQACGLDQKEKESISTPSLFGAGGGTRTHTMSPSTDFESVTSANSITPAYIRPFGQRLYCITVFPKSQVLPQDFFARGSNLSEKFTNTPCIPPENTL